MEAVQFIVDEEHLGWGMGDDGEKFEESFTFVGAGAEEDTATEDDSLTILEKDFFGSGGIARKVDGKRVKLLYSTVREAKTTGSEADESITFIL